MTSGIDYEFLNQLERLYHIPYHRTDLLLEVEQDVYTLLQQNPDDINGLIVLLKSQQMQGHAEKARALTHKVWKIGGGISSYMEYVYAELLMSLGMLDMVLTILQPRFNDLPSNMAQFHSTFTRFALLTGNIPLLEKVLAAKPEFNNPFLQEFAATYRRLEYCDHFKNIQRLVAETIKNHRLGFEYILYHDRGFTDLSAIYYTDIPFSQCASAGKSLNQKIDGYLASSGVKRLYNYEIKLQNISEHPEDFQIPPAQSTTETTTVSNYESDLAKDWGL